MARSGLTRRRLTQALGAAGLLGGLPACADKDPGETGETGEPAPAPDRAPEPDPFVPEGDYVEDAAAFPWGIQVGDPAAGSVVVSFWTTETEALAGILVYASEDGWRSAALLTEGLVPGEAGAVQLTLADLLPDAAYSLCFFTADGARRSPVVRFRTAPAAESERRKIVFGATSCFGGNWPFPSLSYAADERLDFFLLLGDTVYADGSSTAEEYRSFYQEVFGAAPLQALFHSTGVIATWDDHEVDNNWSWDEISEEKFEIARAAYWEALPQGRGEGGTQIWRKIAWGPDVDVFVLDCRGERRDGDYISAEQMAWFKAGLAASTARFKVILNSVPITDMTSWYGVTFQEDRWQGYAQRTEILQFIRDNAVEGVLWVSGDHHLGMVNRVDVAGGPGDNQWEVLSGPAGSFINVLGELIELDDQYQMVILEWSWTRFELDPNLGTCVVQFIGDDGSVLGEQTLPL